MNKVVAILEKEWLEGIKNRMVLMIAILLPLLFTVLPLGLLAATRNAALAQSEIGDLPAAVLTNPVYAGLSPVEVLQVFMMGQLMVMFLIVPLAIPMTIATYSIVGEKREKSLEPLLATPISVEQLLLGKAVAAALPGVLAVWVGFAVFAVGARFLVVSDAVYRFILSPTWLTIVGAVAPLLTVLAVSVGLMVSSRVNDPRAAEQVGMIVILPILGLFFGQIAGVVVLNVTFALALAGGLVLIDAVLIYFGAELFQRETILTRWK